MSDSMSVENRDEFERYPALASWIERLANTKMDLPLGDWCVFVGSLNHALLAARQEARQPSLVSREEVARVLEPLLAAARTIPEAWPDIQRLEIVDAVDDNYDFTAGDLRDLLALLNQGAAEQ